MPKTNKKPVLEKTIVNKILKFLKSLDHCFCWKEHGGMYGTAGIPDIICCYQGDFIAFEVKRPGGNATILQRRTLERINKAGGCANVVSSVEEVKLILRYYNQGGSSDEKDTTAAD